jgi:hypothetical protein
MIYAPANKNTSGTGIGTDVTYTPGKGFEGARWQFSVAPRGDHIGEVQTWNVDTGQRVWDPQLCENLELGWNAGDGRRIDLQRRNYRSLSACRSTRSPPNSYGRFRPTQASLRRQPPS